MKTENTSSTERRPFIRVETDGSQQNTKVFGPRGERIEGIIAVKLDPVTKDTPLNMGTATITLYLDGNGPQPEQALLGLATTKELLNELSARAEINGYANYRTAGESVKIEVAGETFYKGYRIERARELSSGRMVFIARDALQGKGFADYTENGLQRQLDEHTAGE